MSLPPNLATRYLRCPVGVNGVATTQPGDDQSVRRSHLGVNGVATAQPGDALNFFSMP